MARRHHIKRGSNILPDPYESDWVPKNQDEFLHGIDGSFDGKQYGGHKMITPGRYDIWLDKDHPDIDPTRMPDGFDTGFWPSWATGRGGTTENKIFVSWASDIYETIETDEIAWFKRNLGYHTGLNNNWLFDGYLRTDTLKEFRFYNNTDVPEVQDHLKVYGGYYAWGDYATRAMLYSNGVRETGANAGPGFRVFDIKPGNPQPTFGVWGTWNSPYEIKNWNSLTEVTGSGTTHDSVGTWRSPNTNDILQLMGQLPRHHHLNGTGTRMDDICDFFLADANSDPIKRIPAPIGNNWYKKNISGLTMLPNGKYQGLSSIDQTTVNNDHFGVATCFATFRKNGSIGYTMIGLAPSRNSTDLYGNLVTPANFTGVAVGCTSNAAGHGGGSRHCRVKTVEERGYKLVIEGDKVLVVDPTDSRTDMPIGMERGIALRYMNRKHRVVLRSYSQIQTEATELLSNILIESN